MPCPLPVRQIGPLTVSAIGLGCMNLSHGYLPRPDTAQAERLLLHALESGVTFFDTAAIYGFGRNEELLGRTLMHRRNEFTLASKCVLAEVDGKRGLDGSPQAITRVLDDALRRLQVDHIDLYYMHRLDAKVPIEESMGAMARAVEAGKIRAIGLSEMSAATIKRAHAVHPIAAVQTEYSPWTRNPEIAVLDACKELGIGFVAFSPLGRGLLAGRINDDGVGEGDMRADMPRFLPPHLGHNLALYEKLRAVADEAGCSAAQLCLAWVLSKGEHIVPIPGTTSIAHLDEDLAALSLDLPGDVLAAVDALFPAGVASGARYSRLAQSQTDTETWPGELVE
ncbi:MULTISPECIES: aldo/keto reductase [Sphingobium]|uniref:Aldo/keto reductase n=1 Tax=Sphingobium tyrosinilyticum TaxID=2715436 RepID=A0ABV9EZT8_9SPHN|nr:aldo/keto reductase [Sphingobium sp. EP60837]ANI79532.1 Pyridoxine 4-dehydrogenase [Sphingobium sp. EP60837]